MSVDIGFDIGSTSSQVGKTLFDISDSFWNHAIPWFFFVNYDIYREMFIN